VPTPLQQLNAGRIAAGVGAFANPTLTGTLLGIGGPTDAHLAARLFGARDIALGVATLTAAQPAAQTALIRTGLICDALDIVAALAGRRAGTLRPQLVAATIAAAGAAVAIGLTALAQQPASADG